MRLVWLDNADNKEPTLAVTARPCESGAVLINEVNMRVRLDVAAIEAAAIGQEIQWQQPGGDDHPVSAAAAEVTGSGNCDAGALDAHPAGIAIGAGPDSEWGDMNHEAALRRELATLALPMRARGVYPLFHHVAGRYAERSGMDRIQAVGMVFDLVAEVLETTPGNQCLDGLVRHHFEQKTLAGRLQELVEGRP